MHPLLSAMFSDETEAYRSPAEPDPGDTVHIRFRAAKAVDGVTLVTDTELPMEKLRGGTFTITNLGMYGIESFTPIINQPEVAILGVAFPNLGSETDEAGVADFLAENGYTYPVLMDTEGEMLYAYGINAFPTTFMIDPEGNIFGYATGGISLEIMEDIIGQTLAGRAE